MVSKGFLFIIHTAHAYTFSITYVHIDVREMVGGQENHDSFDQNRNHRDLQISTDSVQVSISICSTHAYVYMLEYACLRLLISILSAFIPFTCVNRELKRGHGVWEVWKGAVLLATPSLSNVLCAKSVPQYPHK